MLLRVYAVAAALLAASAPSASAVPRTARHPERVASLLRRAPARLRATASAHAAPRVDVAARRSAPGQRRIEPAAFGGDATGVADSTDALQAAVQWCVNASLEDPGLFPGSEDNWGPVRDAGGCVVDLAGGEYRTSRPVHIPEMVANMEFGHGSIVASEGFPAGEFLLVVGKEGSCKFPQGSCNMDLNFPDLFLDGSGAASGMQVNNVMGTSIGPGGYFLNFTDFGMQVNAGHEVIMDRCWLGETNFDFKFAKHGLRPRATAIQINGNDHYIVDTIVFSSKIGVQVNGAADVLKGVHVWFPENQALAFNDTMAFHVPQGQNRFDGCYIDAGRAVFEGGGLASNLWTNGFECCTGPELEGVPHGIILRGDSIGPGLHIFGNMFGGGGITHEPSRQGVVPVVAQSRISDNSFSSGGRSSKATLSLTQKDATSWKFDFCNHLIFAVVASAQVSLQASEGFPRYAVRPSPNCTLLVETDVAVSGTMTVTVDSSSPGHAEQSVASFAI